MNDVSNIEDIVETSNTASAEADGTPKAPVALIFPSLNPTHILPDLIKDLQGKWEGPIVVIVNDGSNESYDGIFNEAQANGATICRHVENLGKGRALKTAFNEIMISHPEVIGAVTADADGQHHPDDICAVADAMRVSPDALILGCRDFDSPDVPFKSRNGNKITRVAMKFLCGVKVSDTQTGLRGIPMAFMRELMNVSGERFEFETNMLLETKRTNTPIKEIKIDTIYQTEDERVTHFNTFRDSFRIYMLIFKFALSSVAASVTDFVLFTLFLSALEGCNVGIASIAIATVLARCISSVINFLINKNVVFRSDGKIGIEAIKYLILCLINMAASATLVTALNMALGANAIFLKIIVDVCLFFVNYYFQRIWVFKPHDGTGRKRDREE